MIKKRLLILLPATLLSLASIIVTSKVMMGELGNGESWRLICATIGTALIVGMSSIYIFKLLKNQ
jgi:hypothetical protein